MQRGLTPKRPGKIAFTFIRSSFVQHVSKFTQPIIRGSSLLPMTERSSKLIVRILSCLTCPRKLLYYCGAFYTCS